MTSGLSSVLVWLTDEVNCPITYDDWSDNYTWSCNMIIDGRYSGQKVEAHIGEALIRQHVAHHDYHCRQVQDWCIGVRDYHTSVETICSHEVESSEDEANDWMVF